MKIDIKNVIKIALLMAVALIAIFYIFAQGVNIRILPKEASEYASLTLKKGIGLTFSSRFIFFPGEKKLLIQSPGFYDEELSFLVDSSSDTYDVELKKLPGNVRFLLLPKVEGEVYIDKKLIESEQGVYSINAGRHFLEIDNPLYVLHSSTIEVLGMDTDQDFSIVLEPNWATVLLDSTPKEAEVYLSNNYLGKTPLKKDIVSGLHEVIYKKEGYEDFTSIERIEKGSTKILNTVNLKPLPATVRVTSNPSKAKVLIDNSFRGFTPINISLNPNKDHSISLELDGYAISKKPVNLPSNNNSKLNFNLQPILGKVSIKSNFNAEIFVDGKFLGNSPYVGNLHAIKKNITIKKKGYRTFSTDIKPSREFETTVSAELITEENARFAESLKFYETKGSNQMVLLQPGLIEMGAKRSQPGQRANETIRKVQLTKPFYLSIHEVTNSQFSSFMKKDSRGKKLVLDELPIVDVSWNDAALYCNWLSAKEGLSLFYKVNNKKIIGFNLNSEGYRMPTESEWSWSARNLNSKKNSQIIFPWGMKMPVKKGSGNFSDESAKKTSSSYIPNYSDGFSGRSPVGSFQPNNKGVYDLGGNVSEFVNDFYSILNDSNITYTNLTGPNNGRGHVVKGSNWDSSSLTELRYSYRDESSIGDNKTGFRIARWLIGKNYESD